MHSTLPTHVLALAPDSLSSLGELDNESLSELWSVFTRCKDNLQNGRRLENLSWRLWFDSGRRDSTALRRSRAESEEGANGQVTEEDVRQKAVEAGWSDPEWEETSGSESESVEGGEDQATRQSGVEEESTPVQPSQPRGRTVSVPAAVVGRQTRPTFVSRGLSREWRTTSTISGDSLQRMITDSSILPTINLPQRPRSLAEIPIAPSSKPSLESRGTSAPEHLDATNALLLDPPPPSKTPCIDADTTSGNSTPKPPASRSPSDPPIASTSTRPESPTLTRTSPPSSLLSGSNSSMPPPPVPSMTTRSAEAAPPRRRSSVKLARSSSSRKSKSASAALPLPLTTPSTHLTRAPSEVHLKRNLSSAEVAASFKPQSFTSGFDVSSPPSQSAPRPQIGRIAPPPTPAGASAVLAESPPKSRAHSTPVRNAPLTFSADKVPPPPSTSSHRAPQPGPSALKMNPKPPGTSKKIFFISSPNSESDEDHQSCVSKESVSNGSIPKIGSPLQQMVRPPSERSAKQGGGGKGKGKGKEVEAKVDNEDDWDDEEDDEEEGEDGSSSGWGSEYSTDSEVARNSTANGPPSRPMTGRSKSAVEPALFAKRAPSMVHLSPSMSDIGGPGELKRRPPGLLSQLFHPDQFVDDEEDDTPSLEMKRGHKSMSSLPSMAQREERSSTGAKPRGLLGDRLTMSRPPPAQRQPTQTFTKKGKPEDVELESSSEEEEEEDVQTGHEKNETAAALARRQRQAELEQAAAMAAPPQTPRTTRRAMLATELSESLRRNLLWERQTRNRVMGGAPRPPVIPGQVLPQHSASTTQLAPPPPSQLPPPVAASDSAAGAARQLLPPQDTGVRAPHPSPANPPLPRVSSHAALPRRATLATDLSRASQFPKARRPESDSDISDSSEDDGEPDVSGDVYTATALGRGVW